MIKTCKQKRWSSYRPQSEAQIFSLREESCIRYVSLSYHLGHPHARKIFLPAWGEARAMPYKYASLPGNDIVSKPLELDLKISCFQTNALTTGGGQNSYVIIIFPYLIVN